MLFNSFVFAGLFLPLSLVAFWSAPSPESRRAVLLVGSLVFYAYWLPSYLLLLVGFVGVAWLCAILAEKTNSAWPVWIGALLLFGGLGFYKYAEFFVQIAIGLGLRPMGFRVQQLVLPLGISFIVFQTMGYLIDVHDRKFTAEKRFSVVLLFQAFFPQLIAGPICRAHELMPQLRGSFVFRLEQFTSGLAIFSLGMLLKEFFADGIAPLVDILYASKNNPSFYEAWAASIGFGGQIYADFWGYSTMAVGLARMFGIIIPVNFHLPYFSNSLREFWRRWHITLSQWLRDYLYKALGGSRHGPYRTVAALLITMLLGGLWHGANYTFIIWGGIHGIALVLEHAISSREVEPSHRSMAILRSVLGWVYTFFVVFVGWVIFRSTDISQSLRFISAMFSPHFSEMNTLPSEIMQITFLSLLLIVLQVPIEWLLKQSRQEKFKPGISIGIAFLSLLLAVVLGSPVAVPFIYFQF